MRLHPPVFGVPARLNFVAGFKDGGDFGGMPENIKR
jgi:hypothetical protein